jgi:hypothetical protein
VRVVVRCAGLHSTHVRASRMTMFLDKALSDSRTFPSRYTQPDDYDDDFEDDMDDLSDYGEDQTDHGHVYATASAPMTASEPSEHRFTQLSVALGNHASAASPGSTTLQRSNVMTPRSSGPTVSRPGSAGAPPGSGEVRFRTAREADSEVAALQKQILDLQMQLHFSRESLDEAHGGAMPDHVRENIELRTRLVAMQRDNEELQQLLHEHQKSGTSTGEASEEVAKLRAENNDLVCQLSSAEDELLLLRSQCDQLRAELERERRAESRRPEEGGELELESARNLCTTLAARLEHAQKQAEYEEAKAKDVIGGWQGRCVQLERIMSSDKLVMDKLRLVGGCTTGFACLLMQLIESEGAGEAAGRADRRCAGAEAA